MKVILRNPNRQVEVTGRRRVGDLLKELNILPDTVLVIRGRELLTTDAAVAEDDVIEVRPVISGGCGGAMSGPPTLRGCGGAMSGPPTLRESSR